MVDWGDHEGRAWADDGDALLHRTMNPYRAKQAIYLRRAAVVVEDGSVVARGEFAIDESCYIDDTGHFNAVEFVICYNQLMYYALAATIDGGLSPGFAGWTIDDFWERQLPDVLIHKLDSTYARPIGARAFRGEFRIGGFGTRGLSRGMLTLDTSISFWDATGGRAKGSVGLALVNVPEAARSTAAHVR